MSALKLLIEYATDLTKPVGDRVTVMKHSSVSRLGGQWTLDKVMLLTEEEAAWELPLFCSWAFRQR